MTSKLCHNFKASQAVHGADDITIPHFQSQVNSLSICGPLVDTRIYCQRLECPKSYSIISGMYCCSIEFLSQYWPPRQVKLLMIKERNFQWTNGRFLACFRDGLILSLPLLLLMISKAILIKKLSLRLCTHYPYEQNPFLK